MKTSVSYRYTPTDMVKTKQQKKKWQHQKLVKMHRDRNTHTLRVERYGMAIYQVLTKLNMQWPYNLACILEERQVTFPQIPVGERL